MVNLDEILNPSFNWDNFKIDEDEFDELSAELIIDFLVKNTPKERQLLVLSWNFDNSKKVIKWIVDQADTDKGTILYLYWHMAPIFYKNNYADKKECEKENPYDLEDYNIIETIEKNYISNFYKDHVYAFNPHNDLYSKGYDWTDSYDENKVKSKIPSILFETLSGEFLETPNWEEGIPSDISDLMDKLCEAVDEDE